MNGQRLVFTGPGALSVESFAVPDPGPNSVRVQTTTSAISPGTERLLYRGDAPDSLESTVAGVDGDLSYPLAYGYATVGRVTAVGERVDDDWLDRRVFAYNPHESHFLAEPEELVVVPAGVSSARATLLATMETAVTVLLDGEPLLGERVAVFGQGVIGLTTTALLAQTAIENLVAVEPLENRRELAGKFGADHAIAPSEETSDSVRSLLDGGADLTYELSGEPATLDDAIQSTGYDGRVIVGSWYGRRPTELDLGGRFHRDRIEVRSSQVSTIAPKLRGRWSRERRHDVAWRWLDRLDLEAIETDTMPLGDAERAYRLLDRRPAECVGVRFTYG